MNDFFMFENRKKDLQRKDYILLLMITWSLNYKSRNEIWNFF